MNYLTLALAFWAGGAVNSLLLSSFRMMTHGVEVPTSLTLKCALAWPVMIIDAMIKVQFGRDE